MKKTAMILAATALCMSMPLASTGAFAKDAAVSDDANSDENKIRCRKIAVTGSLVRKTKVCRTVAEWREMSDRGNSNAREINERGNVCSGGPGCQGN